MKYLQFLLDVVSRHFETIKPVNVAPKECLLRDKNQVLKPYSSKPCSSKKTKALPSQGVKRHCGQSQKSIRNAHKNSNVS